MSDTGPTFKFVETSGPHKGQIGERAIGTHIGGRSGELRKGYQIVARLGRWKIDRLSDVVNAEATDINRFWISDPHLELRLKIGPRLWIWASVEVVTEGPPLSIRVHGSPQMR